MALYALEAKEILTLTAILVPSLATIWVIFLQRDLNDKIQNFKKNLKDYRRDRALELFEDIKDFCKTPDVGSEEESLEIIMDYTDDWQQKDEAISKLLSDEKMIYKIGKFVLSGLLIVFLFGLYTTSNPNDLVIWNYSRLHLTQSFFVVEIFLIFFWFWRIYSYAIILNTVQSGDFDDIEELIEETIENLN
ncbi:hypothetical protein J2755_001230 [Methanohalophilus levihalophilus]|uniref:hypothetical protein n=1 Tax=Methanohalophilus levihalophilus TaxID=1431282 RepID=UPI001AE64C1F|nr:hypothetical protein [Methanohalophilus levihalophilus]MBP2030296.1 hypothetical protein [Methanohalophilus levihalophilus]